MDERYALDGISFVWDAAKAQANVSKHRVSFEQAAEAFFDPFLRVVDASPEEEGRDALIGMDERRNLLFVVHIGLEGERSVSESSPPVALLPMSAESMKAETLRKRLDRNRPMTSVTLRMPEDVLEDLKRLAPALGFSGYQPLIRTYVGQGMRQDLKRLEKDRVSALVESLRRHGVSEDLIATALEDVNGDGAA